MINFRFISAGEERDSEAVTKMVKKVTKEDILENLYYVPMAKNENSGNTAVEIGDIRFGYAMIKKLDENKEEDSERPYIDNISKLRLTINDDAMKRYGITEEELKKNVRELEDYKMVKLSDLLYGLVGQMQGERAELPYDLSEVGEILAVFGKDGMSGANVLTSDKALSEIEERTGGSFYVLPSSIYEVLIVPKSFGADERMLRTMVKEVNAEAVNEKEQLSDSIFKYEKGNIKMITGRNKEKNGLSLD